MSEILVNLCNGILKGILLELGTGLMLFIPVQVMVYIWGRMLGLLNTDRARNGLAIGMSIGVSYAYLSLYGEPLTFPFFLWKVFYTTCCTLLFYVLVGFKLYDRVDHLLDEKIADDKPKRKSKK